MDAIFIHYLHYLSFALLTAALAVELILHRDQVDGTTARKLARIDALYGLAALVVLATGLLKMTHFGKPVDYYGHNFVFHIKLTVFLIIVLLAITPSVKYFKARKTADGDTATYPRAVGILLKVEMALLVIMPLLGVMMARGYGYTG